jgi:UDP-MurNAc hydroxylase
VRITTLGHAGLKVESASTTLLIDPWVSPFGAFQSSWFQYPQNQHVVDTELFTPTAIVVSHEHLDHLDAWFLERVSERVPVIVPRYPSPAARRKITAARGGPIVELDPWEWFYVGAGMQVMFVAEASPMNHDSAVVVTADGHALLDLNDARLSPTQIAQVRAAVRGHIDVLTVQGSGATWHPMCYDLPPDKKRRVITRKRAAKLLYVERVVTAAQPAHVFPFAGPPCFLDEELFSMNREMDGGLFPDQYAVAGWLERRGHANVSVLLPGDVFDVAPREHTIHPMWAGFESGDRWEYLRGYAATRADAIRTTKRAYPQPSQSLWVPFREYFEELLSLSPYFNRRIAMRVGFELEGPGGGHWAVDFRDGTSGVYDELGECQYRYRFATRWLPAILDGRVPWEDFFLSMRFRATREPDVYNDYLLGVLKFANRQALDAVEEFERDAPPADRVVVEAEGARYSVQRYCPHAWADLRDTSQVVPGRILRCLNHYFEFDLETGRCLNGAAPPLDSRRV